MSNPEHEFARLLRDYPDAVTERWRFLGLLGDYLPGERALISALMAAYDLRIHEELGRTDPPDPFLSQRCAAQLVNECGLQEDLANQAVNLWVSGFPQGGLPPVLPKPAAPPPAPTPPDQHPRPRPAPAKPVPSAPQPASYAIPCGVGKQDRGFVVTGIRESPFCSHPQAGIYAVVFSYLQRSLDARPGDYIRQREAETRLAINYARVFRLQMVLLLLIKNDYCNGGALELRYDGDVSEMEAAVGNINYYARLFCALAGVPHHDIALSVRPKSPTRISLTPREGCICVSDSHTRETTDRAMWHDKRIKYRISEQNEHLLLALLKEAFGYTEFLEGQCEVLRKMLTDDDRHSLCIMPTSAGKSLIFYFLAILQSCPTFVICPTDLLICDQLRNLLTQHHIDDAVHLRPDVDYESFVPCNKLIYLTPYTFMHHQLILKLIRLNYLENMANVVLDEVHCISNWSHDFRPEYLMLSFNLREYVDKTGYRCFTATADYTVVRDIQTQLDIRLEDVVCPVPFVGRVPRFEFVACDTERGLCSITARTVAGLLQAPSSRQRRTLVFTKTAEASLTLQEEIRNAHGAEVDVYQPEDEHSYLHFAHSECHALIADSDLGIGVNLPDVTDTIHVGLPISKSQFVQELGRAGRRSGEACTTVVYMSKDSYPPGARPFLSRTAPIEEVMALCASDALFADARYALARSIGGIDPQESYCAGIIRVHRAIQERVSEAEPVAFEVLPGEPFLAQASRFMRYLYVLYRVGAIYAWYIVRIDEADRSMVFYIDPKGTAAKRNGIHAIRERTASYLHAMGADPSSIGAVKRAQSVEEVIRHYVDWHYHQFLYHHREQLLEMQDFLEVYRNKDNRTVLEALSAYFSLSLLDVQRDSTRAKSLTIKDITLAVSRGIDEGMIDSAAKALENAYSAKLDYLLFCYRLIDLRHADLSRFERVVRSLSEIDVNELLEHVGVMYEACDEKDRLRMLNALCKRADLKRVIDAVYSRVGVDTVFCGIMALCANNRLGA